jgi:hypothetical protein
MSKEEITQLNLSKKKLTILSNLDKYRYLLILDCSLDNLTTLSKLHYTLIKLICPFNLLTKLPPLRQTLKLSKLPESPNTLIYLDRPINKLTKLPPLRQTLRLIKLPNTLIYLDCNKLTKLTKLPPLPDTLQFLSCDKILDY